MTIRSGVAKPNDLDKLRREIRERFLRYPFEAITERLLGEIDAYGEIEGAVEQKVIDGFCEACRQVLRNLPVPETIGARFAFDARMIRSISDTWNEGAASLSAMILPRPGAEWKHLIRCFRRPMLVN